MYENVRKLLDQLDRGAMQLDESERFQLWFLLTALRGPDRDLRERRAGQSVKKQTTAFVRRETLPMLALSCGAFVANQEGSMRLPLLSNDGVVVRAGGVRPMPLSSVEGRKVCGPHWNRHMTLAYEALGFPIHADAQPKGDQ